MCEDNTCGMCGKCWSCPPGCGTLEECEARVRAFKHGILVQTVGELEDSMDVEAMMDTEAVHKEHFMAVLSEQNCRSCILICWPWEPEPVRSARSVLIRIHRAVSPEKAVSSMESYGMLVQSGLYR